jgi:hypothetical protein
MLLVDVGMGRPSRRDPLSCTLMYYPSVAGFGLTEEELRESLDLSRAEVIMVADSRKGAHRFEK